MSLKIANSKLLTNGFLRVYLKDSGVCLEKDNCTESWGGGKKLSQKTSSEGIVVFKPQASAKSYCNCKIWKVCCFKKDSLLSWQC